jgi:hypothetical protein
LTTQPIQPTIDAYGTYARASNLADHLELSCLHGHAITRSDLGDLISDRSWIARMQELFKEPEPEPRGQFDDAGEEDAAATGDQPGILQANRVFDVLEERSELLADQYPFEVDDELKLREGVDPKTSPYIALLALTLAHAHGVDVEHDPKRILENLVVEALRSKGLRAVDVAGTSREGGDFDDTVKRAAESVSLRAVPEAVITMKHANDEGVDTLGNLPLGDLRIGAWAFLGQATCEKSDGWPKKIKEPSPELWNKMLNLGAMPFAFLAVPHHVETPHFEKLVGDASRLVLDRLRLARDRAEVSEEEASIISAVLDVGVEAPA